MFSGFSDEDRVLRDALGEVLQAYCTPATIRAAWPGGDAATVDKLWVALGEFGLPGLLVAERAGGLGLNTVAAVSALEVAGWAGVPGPVVETVMVVAPALAQAQPDGELLADVLSGRARVAVQRSEPLVPYADNCQAVLQIGDGVKLLLRDDARVEPVSTVDGSRAAAIVNGTGTELGIEAAPLLAAGTLGTAAFLLGLARRQLDLTVAYVCNRRQFGAPIGSFQAVQHPLANALVDCEFAWPAVIRAAESIMEDDPDRGAHVMMAKALASDAAYRVSRVTLQAHGAMGYTTEYDLHLFGKRIWALAADWGSAQENRLHIAEHLGLSVRTAP